MEYESYEPSVEEMFIRNISLIPRMKLGKEKSDFLIVIMPAIVEKMCKINNADHTLDYDHTFFLVACYFLHRKYEEKFC